MATLTYKGRLPGVLCEPQLPRRADDPLRLDVTGFVGFAERGPLNTPVRIEDISQYRTLFGGDLLVARDGGLPVYAYLPQAVQSFFANGGRRCYVVRVAREDPSGKEQARPNRFALPGMVAWNGTALRRVVAPAAWVGRWSDRMQVGTQLYHTPLRVRGATEPYRFDPTTNTLAVDLAVPARTTVLPGDVLRLQFDDDVHLLLRAAAVMVQSDGAAEAPANGRKRTNLVAITVTSTLALAFRVWPAPPPELPTHVEQLSAAGWEPLPAAISALALTADGVVCSLPATTNVAAGDMLRLLVAGFTLLAPVAQVDWAYDAAGDTRFLRVVLSQLLEPVTPAASGTPSQVDFLSFDLLIREGNATLEVWPDARFATWTDVLATGSVTPADTAGRSLRLAKPDERDIFPLGMSALPLFTRPLPDLHASGKDGLDHFDAAQLFLDDKLAGYGLRTIMRRAEELLYLSNPPQPLVKLHSLIPIAEVALIALPDLVHRRWQPAEPLAEPPQPEQPEQPPTEVGFRDCPPPPAQPAAPQPEPALPPLELTDSSDALLPEPFAQQLAAAPLVVAAWEYDQADQDALVKVQEALINVCAARSDGVALLSVPEHFARRELVDWQQQLTGIAAFFDGNPLSYAAAYHGWVQVRELATPELAPLRNVPPDGTVCGMIAAREGLRGAWIAPANERLRGVIGLTPELDEDDWLLLFDRQVNLLRQQPGRFTLMSAHTLSSDPLLWQISVRRLLILLRKLLLRAGAQYVFEPNDTRFQRRVQVAFERQLNRLLENGALTAFQVVTGDAVNTRNDYDNGRLIIEIRVAPSQPVEFISVVLLRTGEDLLEVIER